MTMFYTKQSHPGKAGPSTWTYVMCKAFTKNGEPKREDALITMFGGSDGGKEPALEFCRMLNRASEAFHTGVDPVDQEVSQPAYNKLMDLILEAGNAEDPIQHLLFAIGCQWPNQDKDWTKRAEAANCHPE